MPVPNLPMRFSPGDLDAARPTMSRLTERYEQWWRSGHPGPEPVDVSTLDLVLTWKVAYGDGRLDVWTTDDVEDFLLDWCPRRLAVTDDDVPAIVEDVAEAFTFLGSERLLSGLSVPGDRLAAHARDLADEAVAAMADDASFGMAKSILTGLDLDLDGPLTPEKVDALVAQFNALPEDVRAALVDGDLDEDEDELDVPAVGPVRVPDDAAVRASAAAAPVLVGFAALAEFFRAPGRPLTARGNIRLADAEAISAILGTEALESTIGTKTFKTRSAAELPGLDHWQWWAREAGALRVRNGRLVGVDAWLRRQAKDPAREARKALDVLLDYGPLESYLPHDRRPLLRLVGLVTSPFLALLLSAAEPVPFTAFVDSLEAARAETGVRGAFAGPEDERRESARLVDLLLSLLERAGVVTQQDVAFQQGRFAPERTGGTVALTPFGVVTAVDVVRAAGLEVLTLGDPAALTAADLADLAAREVVGPEGWVALLADWLATVPDRPGAVVDVLRALDGEDSLVQVMLLDLPDPLEDDVAAAMEQLRPAHGTGTTLGAVATMWLAEHGRLDPARLPRGELAGASLTTLAMLAARDPDGVPAAMGADRSRREHLELVAEVARRTPPHAVALLEAIGRHHPDPAVAKAARKELMRLRSR